LLEHPAWDTFLVAGGDDYPTAAIDRELVDATGTLAMGATSRTSISTSSAAARSSGSAASSPSAVRRPMCVERMSAAPHATADVWRSGNCHVDEPGLQLQVDRVFDLGAAPGGLDRLQTCRLAS